MSMIFIMHDYIIPVFNYLMFRMELKIYILNSLNLNLISIFEEKKNYSKD